jgi:hypothetical protein
VRTYLITYDAATPRHGLAGAIMRLGEAWARPLENTWYVQTSARPAVLEQELKAHLDGEDGLLIQPVAAEAVLLNTMLRWFKKRCDAASRAMPTVIAFPSPPPAARAA